MSNGERLTKGEKRLQLNQAAQTLAKRNRDITLILLVLRDELLRSAGVEPVGNSGINARLRGPKATLRDIVLSPVASQLIEEVHCGILECGKTVADMLAMPPSPSALKVLETFGSLICLGRWPNLARPEPSFVRACMPWVFKRIQRFAAHTVVARLLTEDSPSAIRGHELRSYLHRMLARTRWQEEADALRDEVTEVWNAISRCSMSDQLVRRDRQLLSRSLSAAERNVAEFFFPDAPAWVHAANALAIRGTNRPFESSRSVGDSEGKWASAFFEHSDNTYSSAAVSDSRVVAMASYIPPGTSDLDQYVVAGAMQKEYRTGSGQTRLPTSHDRHR